jgi:hypothetical protein
MLPLVYRRLRSGILAAKSFAKKLRINLGLLRPKFNLKATSMTPLITRTSLEPHNPVVLRVEDAFARALDGKSKIPPELLVLQGMSGQIYRKFINNLVEATPNASYLEVGSWAGSTLCSAIHNNKVRAMAIDNWSEFGGPRDLFFANVGKFAGSSAAVSFLNSDFRAVRYDAIGTYNIYLFDGPHTKKDQYDGMALAKPALEEVSVVIVDDWNWLEVRNGTFDALRDAKYQIIHQIEVLSTPDNRHPGDHGLPRDQDSDWHNGYFIGVLRKL